MLGNLNKYCGKQVGQYIIEKPLGQGRYGMCFLSHAQDGRPVVIKRFKPVMLKRNRYKNAFEAVILSQIIHPSIPDLLGVINEKGFYGFILEFKPGITVEAMLYKQKHCFNDSEIYDIGVKLIEILKHLHANGAVHRDIRTSNVLLNHDEVYLVDFGLARWADDDRYRYDVDFAYLGDFLLHLLYSSYTPDKKTKSLPWHQQLNLTAHKQLFIKRLLKIEKPYNSIAEVEIDYRNCFKHVIYT